MKNKYLALYTGFAVFALPIIIGDLYREYKRKDGNIYNRNKTVPICR